MKLDKWLLPPPRKTPAEGIEVTIGGKPLTCPVCGHNRFREDYIVLTNREFPWWTDKPADQYICKKCAHICWFAR